MCRAASGKLWTPGGSGGGSGSKGGPPEREPGPGPREQTAMRLRAICDALPELPEESLVAMIQSVRCLGFRVHFSPFQLQRRVPMAVRLN